MPRSLDPNSKLTFVLACDVDKPPQTQPRIFARTLTLNQQRRLMSAMKRLKTDSDPDAKIEAGLDAAEVCITGWENMTDPHTGEAIAFSREAIGDVLSIDELVEVFEAVISFAKPNGDDQKKSESPPL